MSEAKERHVVFHEEQFIYDNVERIGKGLTMMKLIPS